jgi:ClpP class serine protease
MTAALSSMLWIAFLALTLLLPWLRQRRVEMARVAAIRDLQAARGSRVVLLVHRQESLSFLGFLFSRHITIEDSEQVLRAIRMTPDETPLDLIVHTPGGLVLAAEQIARAIKSHPARTTVFVPHYALSGGTMLALAADQIVMDENAVLGPVDPQIGSFPAASILAAVARKDPNRLDDQTLILADIAEKAVRQVKEVIEDILRPKLEPEAARRLAEVLTEGRWTHDYPITFEQLEGFGLPVSKDMPRQVYRLMELFPQPPQRRPSVQYVPFPTPTGRREREED